ncbi:MAG: hypothetical protein HQK77_10595 [Desulfobacterales bacterium]|nr:hypothetical protein [Desulfobacterales bacterium]
MYRTLKYFIGSLIAIIFLFGCAPKSQPPEAQLDIPEHHVTNGYKMLKEELWDNALAAFTRATELDPKYSPAYVGLSLVNASRNEFDIALKFMEKAGSYAKDDLQLYNLHIGYIRLYSLGREKIHKDWIKKAKNHYKKAQNLKPNSSEPDFYMGIAYKTAYDFQNASACFKRVLDAGNQFIAEADEEYELLQQIERAMPGTTIGKKIGLLTQISRADTAALFIEELKIDALFKKRGVKTFDTSFKGPHQPFPSGDYVPAPDALDIDNHVLRLDIESFIQLGIRGLEPIPDHTFQPDKIIKRAEFAMLLEDILIKVTGEEHLATRFIGSESPFPDLRNDLAYFNAAMVCITRNIMQVKDRTTGEFDPHGTVSGADALLSIRVMKTELAKYVAYNTQ